MVTLRPRRPRHPETAAQPAEDVIEDEKDEAGEPAEYAFEDDAEESQEEVETPQPVPSGRRKQKKREKQLQVDEVKALGSQMQLMELLDKYPAAVSTIVLEWCRGIARDGPGGVARVLNLVVTAGRVEGSGGKMTLVGPGDVLKDAKKVIGDRIVSAVQEEGPGVPRIASKKRRRTYEGFWEKCIVLAPESLLYDVDAFETIVAWLTTFASSPARAVRLAASIATYSIVHGLIKVRLSLIDTVDALERQGKSIAAKTRGKGGSRRMSPQSKELRSKIETLNANGADLDALTTEIFNSIFVLRYRDTCPQVRGVSIVALGEWILAYPARFLDDMHSKYIGWLLYDKVPAVRGAALGVLTKLYSDEEHAAALELFLRRFLARILEMTRDVDVSVARRAIDLCTTLVKYDVLDEGECESVYDLCTAPGGADSVRRAVGRFIAELFRARRIEEGGSPRPVEEVRELVFTVLRNGGEAGVSSTLEALWDVLPSVGSWESYLKLLLENGAALAKVNGSLSSSGVREDTIDAKKQTRTTRSSSQDKENRENGSEVVINAVAVVSEDLLTDHEQVILAQLLFASARKLSELRSAGSKRSSQKREHRDDREAFTLVFAPQMNRILTHYQSEAEMLTYLLRLPQFFNLHVYKRFHHESHFKMLLERLGDALSRHTSNYATLLSAAQTLKHLAKTAHPLQPIASVALSKESSKAAELLDSLILLDLEKLQDSVSLAAALARSLSLASVTQLSERVRKNSVSLLQARVSKLPCILPREVALHGISLALTLTLWSVPSVRVILEDSKYDNGKSTEIQDFLQHRDELLFLLTEIVKKDSDKCVSTKAAITILTLITVFFGLSSRLRAGRKAPKKDSESNKSASPEMRDSAMSTEMESSLAIDLNDFDMRRTLYDHCIKVLVEGKADVNAEKGDRAADADYAGLLTAAAQAISRGALPYSMSFLPVLGLCLRSKTQKMELKDVGYEVAKLFHVRFCDVKQEVQAIKAVGERDSSDSLETTKTLVNAILAKYSFGKNEGLEQLVQSLLDWTRADMGAVPNATMDKRWMIVSAACSALVPRLPKPKLESLTRFLESLNVGEISEAASLKEQNQSLNLRTQKKAELVELFDRCSRGDSGNVRKRAKHDRRVPRKAKKRARTPNDEAQVRRSSRKRKIVDYRDTVEENEEERQSEAQIEASDSDEHSRQDKEALIPETGLNIITDKDRVQEIPGKRDRNEANISDDGPYNSFGKASGSTNLSDSDEQEREDVVPDEPLEGVKCLNGSSVKRRRLFEVADTSMLESRAVDGLEHLKDGKSPGKDDCGTHECIANGTSTVRPNIGVEKREKERMGSGNDSADTSKAGPVMLTRSAKERLVGNVSESPLKQSGRITLTTPPFRSQDLATSAIAKVKPIISRRQRRW